MNIIARLEIEIPKEFWKASKKLKRDDKNIEQHYQVVAMISHKGTRGTLWGDLDRATT